MDLGGEIVSGHSIAGITLGTPIETVLFDLTNENHDYVETTFSNLGRSHRMLTIAGGKVTVVSDKTNCVVRLSCHPGYLGKYRRTFYPGMTVKQICEHSTHQLLINGLLVVDKDIGAGFTIPDVYEGDCYDDVNYIEDLPAGMVLEELNVIAPPEWWQP